MGCERPRGAGGARPAGDLHLLPAAGSRPRHDDLRWRGPGARLPRAAARYRGEDAGAAEDGELRAQPTHAGHLPEKAGGLGVINDTLGVLFFLVALLAAAAMARYYVLGVLTKDTVASRSAAVGFLVFSAAAVWSLVGVLT